MRYRTLELMHRIQYADGLDYDSKFIIDIVNLELELVNY